jgi:hypothetical protein
MRWIKRILLCAGIGGLLLAAALALFYPRFLVAFCPQCFGFDKVAEGLYVQSDVPAIIASHSGGNLLAADAAVKAFFGERQAGVTFLVCGSDACYRRFTGTQGTSLSMTFFHGLIIVSPRGNSPAIFTHELAHAELEQRLGIVLTPDVPAWFEEGLATFVSNDARYIGPPGKGDRCLADPAANLPASRFDWPDLAGSNHRLYASAACRVSRWLEAHGGQSAIITLIQKMKNGAAFAEAYGGP